MSASSLAIAVYSSNSMTMVASAGGQLSRCRDDEDAELKSSARIVAVLTSDATGLPAAAAAAESFSPSSMSLTEATRRRTSLRAKKIDRLKWQKSRRPIGERARGPN